MLIYITILTYVNQPVKVNKIVGLAQLIADNLLLFCNLDKIINL